MNTCVSRIAWRQAHLGGFDASPFPSLEALANEDGDDGDDGDDGADDDDEDEDEDASSANDNEMMTSQWLTICHSWQKGEVVLGCWE